MKQICLLIFVFSLLSGCNQVSESPSESKSKPNDSVFTTVKSKVASSYEQFGMDEYTDGEDIKLKEKSKKDEDGITYYSFNVESFVYDEFVILDKKVQTQLVRDVADDYYADFDCGETSICKISNFTFKSEGSNTYKATPEGTTVAINGEEYEPAETADSPTSDSDSDSDYSSNSNQSTDSSSNTNTNESTTTGGTSPSVNKEAVYAFMKRAYDRITNYGENYNPEVHDEQVADMAAQQFGITSQEAGDIYVEFEMAAAGSN